MRAAAATTALLWLQHPAYDDLHLAALLAATPIPTPTRAWPRARLAHAEELAYMTLQTGSTCLDPITDAATPTFCSVPLRTGAHSLGVLQVAAGTAASLSSSDIQLVETLAAQAAALLLSAGRTAALDAEYARLAALVEATNDALLMLDDHMRVILVNRRARYFFGLHGAELLDRELQQCVAVLAATLDQPRQFVDWCSQTLPSHSERAVAEFRTLRPEVRTLQCFSGPVLAAGGDFLGRLLVFRDITRERENERMKNEFVAIVSHELRTPLTSVRGALQLVLGRPAIGSPPVVLTPRAHELLHISLNNTERLIRLINDILDIARIEQGQIGLQRETLAPRDLCVVARQEVTAFATHRDISIELAVPDDMPPVYADRDRVVQILGNLLSNAIKFSPAGRPVNISAAAEDGYVRFAVRDQGAGIAAEDQVHIFEKFRQVAGTTTRDTIGSGLGLAICKALVEEHGGTIGLDSIPTYGSTFYFTLPRADG